MAWTKEHDKQAIEAILRHAHRLRLRDLRGKLSALRHQRGLIETQMREIRKEMQSISDALSGGEV